MAQIEIHKAYPFVSWDAKRKYGETDKEIYVTISFETAKTKAGWNLFEVFTTWGGTKQFSSVYDATEYAGEQLKAMARQAGWTPEGELG